MFGPPVPSADLPASVRDTAARTSRIELADRTRVRPPAYCWFRTSTKLLAGELVSPGIGLGSKLLTLRWLKRKNAVVAAFSFWSNLMSNLSLKLSCRGSESKLFELPGRVGSGRPASTFLAKSVIAACGTTPLAYSSPVTGLRIGTPRLPWRWASVGMLANVTCLETSRKPS